MGGDCAVETLYSLACVVGFEETYTAEGRNLFSGKLFSGRQEILNDYFFLCERKFVCSSYKAFDQ